MTLNISTERNPINSIFYDCRLPLWRCITVHLSIPSLKESSTDSEQYLVALAVVDVDRKIIFYTSMRFLSLISILCVWVVCVCLCAVICFLMALKCFQKNFVVFTSSASVCVLVLQCMCRVQRISYELVFPFDTKTIGPCSNCLYPPSSIISPSVFLNIWSLRILCNMIHHIYSPTTSFRFNSSIPTKLLIPLFPPCKCDLWCLYILWCIAFHWIIIDLSETIFLTRINSPFPRSFELLNILPKMWNR